MFAIAAAAGFAADAEAVAEVEGCGDEHETAKTAKNRAMPAANARAGT
ncbi:MAG TPA: hypothetical protein VLV86_07345 [Vicinamibacterales bacterium]|nr:hypothetical protein [Vicinamibacterales bacterium]